MSSRETRVPDPVKAFIKRVEEDTKAIAQRAEEAVREIERARKKLQQLVGAPTARRG